MGSENEEPANWHELLDRLIAAKGDQADFALRLCKAAGRNSDRDFETARRNLANWTTGKAIPQRRNFETLSRVLGVAGDPELHARWNKLYVEARGRSGDEPANPLSSAPARPQSIRWAALFAVFVGIVAAGVLGYRASGLGQDRSRTIGYLPFAELKVGQSVLVHAKRGECGGQPPEWYQIKHEIPILNTGRLVDDGLGTSQSTTCGGLTPGRLVRFVAETPGEEVFELFQRRIKVVVHE